MALESLLCYNPKHMTNTEYLPTIGLEIHAELNTKTKMFCNSKNDAAEIRPNINVCPVCLAHPGTLPVINKAAVEHVLRVGAALGAKLADYTEFDRKNYFYPDLPKGYQLSQFEYPLVSGGELNGVKITRVHLEEDTASSIHDENSGATLIDYNRAGVPLMELVTEPVIHTAEDAGNFGRELQLLLRYLGASEADMEKGQMRLEANISVAKIARNSAENNDSRTSAINSASGVHADNSAKNKDTEFATIAAVNSRESSPTDLSQLGTKVEVKNINSFRAMERAIQFEVKRQIALLERGEKVVQETRGWDENKQQTFSQRVKEGSADYRYFPDPDLPSLKLSEIGLTKESVERTLPELPWQRRERYNALGINTQDVESYVKDPLLGGFFEEVVQHLSGNKAEIKLASNYIGNDLVKLVSDIRDNGGRDTKTLDKMPISAVNFAAIIRLAASRKISSMSAKELLAVCVDGVSDPIAVANDRKLIQEQSAGDIKPIVAKIIADNPTVVADFKSGKATALEYLVGQGMKALRGAADPVALRAEISEQLK
jgi:aspartyl-tRNA(Asn)/glutamyl-tRNA(Gln) amidotransferase subunit B